MGAAVTARVPELEIERLADGVTMIRLASPERRDSIDGEAVVALTTLLTDSKTRDQNPPTLSSTTLRTSSTTDPETPMSRRHRCPLD